MRIGNVRIKPRFFIMVLLLCAVVYGFAALIGALLPQRITWGRLDTTQSATALVLRDEIVCTSPESGRFSCLAAEGSLVEGEGQVALLYRSGYSEKYSQNLLDLQQTIKDWQENNILMDVIDSDLVALNEQIDTKMEEIRQAVQAGDHAALLPLEGALATLMQQRQGYMKQTLKADDYLGKLYEQEASLQQKIADTQLLISAPQRGLVSFIFDNCESLLTVQSIPTLTPEGYRQIEKQVQKGTRPNTSGGIIAAQAPLYRLVNPDVWYAVLCMRARDCTLTPNAACEVSFDGLPHTLQATVYHMTQQGNQVLVVLQMTQGAQEMVSLRQVTGHIGRSAEGFKIPLKALQSDENGYFVQVRAQGGVTAVRVEVLAMDERHAIVGEVAGSGGALVVGMRLVNP